MIRLLNKDARISYSQSGEDLIVDFIFRTLSIDQPTYLDIGAHHPSYINNTYFFYKKGGRGVCVEPDPILFTKIKNSRKRDQSINIGIGVDSQEKANFYILSSKTLNTFSQKEAERYQAFGNQKIEKVINIPLLPINEVIQKYFKKCPNFVSLDVEGLDFEIIKTFNFNENRPEVFCIETLTYTENKTEEKRWDIINFMISNGYMVYADTFINTIFVNSDSWRSR